MRPVPGDRAGDEITGLVVRCLLRDRERDSPPFEKGAKVGDTSVINVSVRAFEFPDFWIFGKRLSHVFMNQFLEVN